MTTAQGAVSVGHDDAELITGEAVALDLRPADFILRGAGALIDAVLYIVVWLLVVFAISLPLVSGLIPPELMTPVIISSLVICLIIVPMVVETLSHGKSLGKLAVGARIVRDDGGAITLRHAAIRSLMGVVDIYLSFGGVAALTGLLNPQAKRLGDFLAGTYAQHERPPRDNTVIFGVPVELTAWAETADVARMPDTLARRIAQFLKQAGGVTPTTRERVSRELANEASRYVSPIPSVHPVLFLAGVAAVRRDREFAALQGEKRRLSALSPVLQGLPHRFPHRSSVRDVN
ncbi:MAG: RDD family protein [Cryobacterium sp.]|nr:RDD family protein [Cryobacterium sp.]